MNKTIALLDKDFTGMVFTNLVEFDSEYGHRRNPQGYGKAIEDFDKQLGEFMAKMNDDDLVMVTADHGNDPTYKGSDHTRENVPLLVYSKQFKNGRMLPLHESFAGIGATIIENFGIKKTTQIGEPIKELLED
jgi:phosphopentomutase